MFLTTGLCLTAIVSGPKPIKEVGYSVFAHGSAKYHLVVADPRHETLSPGTVASPHLTSVWSMINKVKPIVAITGTFFAPRTQNPIADVLVDGKLVATGQRASCVAVDWNGKVRIFDSKFNVTLDWSQYRYALRGVVRVLAQGKVAPNPKAQKFRDKRIWGKASRTCIGLTKSGKILILATSSAVTLSALGEAAKSRGAVDAVSLDGGSSTCLYYNGSLIVPPKRQLSNLFVIVHQSPYRGILSTALP